MLKFYHHIGNIGITFLHLEESPHLWRGLNHSSQRWLIPKAFKVLWWTHLLVRWWTRLYQMESIWYKIPMYRIGCKFFTPTSWNPCCIINLSSIFFSRIKVEVLPEKAFVIICEVSWPPSLVIVRRKCSYSNGKIKENGGTQSLSS